MASRTLVAVVLVVLCSTVGPARSWGWQGGHGYSSDHHGYHSGGHVFVGFGSPWWGPPYPYWYYPPYYGYGAPWIVVPEEPQVYVQQAPPEPAYWYYCSRARAYYPKVKHCSEAWIKVLPVGQEYRP
jgi:hypothetical protein